MARTHLIRIKDGLSNSNLTCESGSLLSGLSFWKRVIYAKGEEKYPTVNSRRVGRSCSESSSQNFVSVNSSDCNRMADLNWRLGLFYWLDAKQ